MYSIVQHADDTRGSWKEDKKRYGRIQRDTTCPVFNGSCAI